MKLTADPDHETQSSYSFTITASDAAGTSAAETVSFNITNVDEAKPTISSGATGTDLVENSGAGQVIYTIAASANDGGAISGYELGGTDGALLSLDGTNVKLTADPDYETKHSYSFTVTASDATATSDAKTVQFSITNVDETAPTITSGDTGTTLAENSGAGQTVYTITADANDDGTIASYAIAGTDADKLDVVASTGVVTLKADPDYETQSSYSFTVTATDAAATSNATTVQFSITNVDDIDPTITSAATGTNLVENSGAGQIVYTIVASANDGGTIASYAIGGTDKDLLTLDGTSVKLTANPDYETKNGYSFWVTATDAAGTSVEQAVSFNITNVDDTIPTITSGTAGTDLAENSGAGQTVYTIAADANDTGTISDWALAGTDQDKLTLTNNVVTLNADPNYETKNSYSFTVTASDATGTSAATTVTFSITNVDETAPTITSGDTGTTLAENSGAGQTVYTITADANDDGTIASYAIAGTDADKLDVVASTGVVTLTADPNYETQSSYSFTVTATDATATSNAVTVTFAITNVDENVPTISSGDSGTNIVTGTAAGATVYTIVANNGGEGTVSGYAIAGTDAALLTLTGSVVTLTGAADYGTKNSYDFTVTATDEAGTSAATNVTFIILPYEADHIFNYNGGSYNIEGISGSNPTLYVKRGGAYKFKMSISGHPLQLSTSSDTTSGGKGTRDAAKIEEFNLGQSLQNGNETTFTFNAAGGVPANVNVVTYYCTAHGGMVGTINIIA